MTIIKVILFSTATILLTACNNESRSGNLGDKIGQMTLPKKILIQDLLSAIGPKREDMWKQGIVDGTGLAFQLTAEYQELEKLLSRDQLLIVDLFFGPPAYAIP